MAATVIEKKLKQLCWIFSISEPSELFLFSLQILQSSLVAFLPWSLCQKELPASSMAEHLYHFRFYRDLNYCQPWVTADHFLDTWPFPRYMTSQWDDTVGRTGPAFFPSSNSLTQGMLVLFSNHVWKELLQKFCSCMCSCKWSCRCFLSQSLHCLLSSAFWNAQFPTGYIKNLNPR